MLAKNIFPYSRIDIEKEYTRYPIEEINSQKIIEFIRSRARTIPVDAPSALSKLAKGDLKGFAETFIDTTICTEIVSLCRDRGPRIKCGISAEHNGVEVYSECFDPELFSHIILGDISILLRVISGYRDFVRFKIIRIPNELLKQDTIEAIEDAALRNRLQENTVMPEGGMARDFFEKLVSGYLEYSEIILMVPCLNSQLIEVIANLMTVAEKSYRRVYIATLPPSQENSSFCRTQYRDHLMLYLQLIEEVKNHKFYVCDSEVASLGAIIDRSRYLISNDFTYSRESFLAPLSDTKYANDYAVYVLKHCLCSNSLLREDRKVLK